MCHFLCNFLNFRKDERNEEMCSVESDVLEESQQNVLQDDSIYDNVDDVQNHVYEMSCKPESENVIEHNGYPESSTSGSFLRHISKISRNQACHSAHGAASIATTKSTTKSKLAPTVKPE